MLNSAQGITHSELAHRMRVSPETVTNMLQRMEKTGFVERRPGAEDQRVSRVYLTDTPDAKSLDRGALHVPACDAPIDQVLAKHR